VREEEYRFLVDVNLPKRFSFFNYDNFSFVSDFDLRMADKQIWEFAKANKQVILTKDADFFHRSLLEINPPKVVHFKLGNQTLSELHSYFELYWPLITTNLKKAKIIVALPDNVEIII